MKSIVLNIDSKCNATCRHCCFSCSPQKNTQLNDYEIDNLIEYFLSNNEIEVVSLTGGEALLRKDKVLEIIRIISMADKKVTLISNGFWVVTPHKAEEVLQDLYDHGLRALTISYDDYHREYIPLERIQNLLTAIKKFDISIALNMVVDRQNRGTKLLNELGSSVFGIQVTMIPASPVGSAKRIPKKDLYLQNYDSFDLKCPSSCLEFVIHHDGFVYPCCSPSVFESNLIIGNIHEETIENLEEKLFSNILLYILMKEGLGWFIKKLNLSEELAKQQFTSTCEICRFIFSKGNIFDLLYEEMLNYSERKEYFV